jgi:hypothetical protein
MSNVVLGNSATDVTDPAALLNNRRIQMGENTFEWGFGTAGWFMVFNDESEGAGPNNIPIAYYSPAASFWNAYTPENFGTVYAPGGTANRFYNGYDIYPGVNPDSTRPNVVGMFWGYNTNFQQGRIDATEAAFRFATETFFEIDGDFHLEFHLPEITTDGGDIFRLDSTYVSRATGLGFRELVINDMQWYDTLHNPSGGLFYMHCDYTTASDTMELDLRSFLTDGVTKITFGNYTDGVASLGYQGTIVNLQNAGEIQLAGEDISLKTTLGVVSSPITFCTDDLSHLATGDAVLEGFSISKGFRPPSVTTAQKLAIAIFGAGGVVVYDSTLNKLCVWTGAAWETVTSV